MLGARLSYYSRWLDPVSLLGSSGDGTLRWYYRADDVTTANSYLGVSAYNNHSAASLGADTMTTGVAAASRYRLGRGRNNCPITGTIAADTTYTSGLASSNFAACHSFAGDYTIVVMFRPRDIASSSGPRILNTKTTSGSGSGLGFTLQVTSGGAIQFHVGNGTSNEQAASANSVISNHETYVAFIYMNSTGTKAINIDLASWSSQTVTNVASTNISFTPSNSNPGHTLALGGGSNTNLPGDYMVFGGLGRLLTTGEKQGIATFLFNSYPSYVSLAQVVNDHSLGYQTGLQAIMQAGASTFTDLLGNHTASLVNSPTFATDSGINNQYACALNGTTQGVDIDTIASGGAFDGADQPHMFMSLGKFSSFATNNRTLMALCNKTVSTGKAFKASRGILTTTAQGYGMIDDSNNAGNNNQSTMSTGTWYLIGASYLGNFVEHWRGGATKSGGTVDVGTCTFNAASIGYHRLGGTAGGWLSGSTALHIFANAYYSFPSWGSLIQAVAGDYGSAVLTN